MWRFFSSFIAFVSLLFGCSNETPFSGIWQALPCESAPCSPRAQLHIGQYGDAVAGVVHWFETQPGINTFNAPSLGCSCNYIQVGSVNADTLRLITFSPNTACSNQNACNACACDRYVIQLTLNAADILVGYIQCESGDRHEIELERTLGTPKDSCSNEMR